MRGKWGEGQAHYSLDHLGNTRWVVSTNWDVYDYYPFGGERVIQAGPSGNHYKFTGKERDPESGLDNFGARFDSSTLGRFMSPDPLMASATVRDPQTWNRYTYALDNPLRFVDPDGMKEVSAEDCKKDPNCVIVKLRIIYDKTAHLSDEQKKLFKDREVQAAKDQYGNSDIHFEVSSTEGGFDAKGNFHGADKDSINVLVTDDGNKGDSAVTLSGYAYTRININRSDEDNLAHELSHHFMGDTIGLVSKIPDLGGLGPLIVEVANGLVFDPINNVQRAQLTDDPRAKNTQRPCTRCDSFNSGAREFQGMLNQQAAIRPRQ